MSTAPTPPDGYETWLDYALRYPAWLAGANADKFKAMDRARAELAELRRCLRECVALLEGRIETPTSKSVCAESRAAMKGRK